MIPADSIEPRLAQLREAMREVRAPASLDAALAAGFRRHHGRDRPRLWWMPPLALAATVALVVWTLREPASSTAPQAVLAAEADPGPFLALKPLERIALEPGTTVVTREFPRALLAEWGLPVSPERAGEPVLAEMLYSPEGEALAVRLVH